MWFISYHPTLKTPLNRMGIRKCHMLLYTFPDMYHSGIYIKKNKKMKIKRLHTDGILICAYTRTPFLIFVISCVTLYICNCIRDSTYTFPVDMLLYTFHNNTKTNEICTVYMYTHVVYVTVLLYRFTSATNRVYYPYCILLLYVV